MFIYKITLQIWDADNNPEHILEKLHCEAYLNCIVCMYANIRVLLICWHQKCGHFSN